MLDYEARVENEYYFGSLDLVLRIDGKNYLADVKTYQAYKYLYGIVDDVMGKRGKPLLKSSDKKKVTMQTSMYRNAYDKFPID